MAPRVGAHIIFGSNPEPFLEAALRSVEWVDYYCAVNTAPEDGIAQQNEATFRRVVPRSKQRLDRTRFAYGKFDFGVARNLCLDLADPGDYVLILDSDDVHYPELEEQARAAMEGGYDIITAHFWHLIGYKDLWGQEPHREILFTKTPETEFIKGVHESLEHPRQDPHLLPDYHYVHYGYIKPPREIFRRWVLYSEIEGEPDHYKGRNPDDALAGWLDNTNPFWREHPPAVTEVLGSYPTAPRSARALPEGTPRNIGLVLLTWDDSENLEACLKTLALTRQPFRLVVVDNNSEDRTKSMVYEWSQTHYTWRDPTPTEIYYPAPGCRWSLAEALNVGFGKLLADDSLDYVGWIHPDMVFERDTWLECLRHALDTHPDLVKVGAWEMDTPRHQEAWSGNSQCYLVRKGALQHVGLFDPRFQACGGYEDWDLNNRLIGAAQRNPRPDLPSLPVGGKVMIWPDAIIRHNAMGTRTKHDNAEAARNNATLYQEIWGTWNPLV